MATTDTRSGFRLPWSSDRSHDTSAPDEAVEEAVDAPAEQDAADAVAWPDSDINAQLGLTSKPRAVDAPDPVMPSAAPDAAQEPAMIDLAPPLPLAPPPPRKPTKLMADLTAAIRATAESAHDEALVQVEIDLAAVVESIRSHSKDGEDVLRARTDEDIAAIKDWSRAEIARIKEATEGRIDARKVALDGELAAHAAAIERRVGDVERTAAGYRVEMEAYAERVRSEEDPARLATMAESMPDAPDLDGWTNVDDLAIGADAIDAAAEPGVGTVDADAVLEAGAGGVLEAEPEVADALVEAAAAVDADAVAVDGVTEPVAVDAVAGEAVDDAEEILATDDTPAEAADDATADPLAAMVWSEGDDAWVAGPDPDAGPAEAGDDLPRWAAGETPEGFPEHSAEGGDPVDRGAIMAALEAAAEAVVAAESAAESADQAEAAADVAETAAELLKGRVDGDEPVDPEAQAALSARMGAGGFEESYADRLASLLPGHGEGAADGEPRVTQVVVSGLVSVASIASFKRHLGRLSGVQSVAVASGPDGEFVFNVTHRPDVLFREALPTMPGFAARVTSAGDGVVQVIARDPEAEA